MLPLSNCVTITPPSATKKSADNPSGHFHATRHRDRRTFRQRIASLHWPALAKITPDSSFDKPPAAQAPAARFAKRRPSAILARSLTATEGCPSRPSLAAAVALSLALTECLNAQRLTLGNSRQYLDGKADPRL